MIHDARLTAWSLTGPAGGTITLRSVVPDALAGATISVWVGGSADDVDDLTGATEVEAVADGGETTWAVPVPVAVASVPLRWTVDGVPATVGRLVPSRRGTTSADVHVPLVVGDVGLSILLPGAGADQLPDDSLGILDPDTAQQTVLDLLLMFDGNPEEGSERYLEIVEAAGDFAAIIPFYASEQPVDARAAIRTIARFLGLIATTLADTGQNQDIWDELNRIWTSVHANADRRPPTYVGPDPTLDGTTPPYGSTWIDTAVVPNLVHLRLWGPDGATWTQIHPPVP